MTTVPKPRHAHYDDFGYGRERLDGKLAKTRALTDEEKHLAECHLARYAKTNPLDAVEVADLLGAMGLPVPEFVTDLVAADPRAHVDTL